MGAADEQRVRIERGRRELRELLESHGYLVEEHEEGLSVTASPGKISGLRLRASAQHAGPETAPPAEPREPTRGERFLTAAEAAQVALWDWDLRTNRVYLSPEFKRQLGYEEHELADDFEIWRSRLHPADKDRVVKTVRAFLKNPWPDYYTEFRIRHRDGSYRQLIAQAGVECDDQGTPVRMSGCHIDVTGRVELRGEGFGTMHWDIPSGELQFSEQCLGLFGIERTPSTWTEFRQALHPADRARADEAVQRAMLHREPYDIEVRTVGADGSTRWTSWQGRAYHDTAGMPVRIEGVARDITPRKRAEQAHVESETTLRQIADSVPHLMVLLAPDGSSLFGNRSYFEYFGRDDLGPEDWPSLVHPDDLDLALGAYASMVAGGPSSTDLLRLRRHDGVHRWFQARNEPVRDDQGKLLYIVCVCTDVHELQQTQMELREAKARLVTALEAAGMGTWRYDAEADEIAVDDSLLKVVGLQREGAPRKLREAIDLVLPRERETVEPLLRKALQAAAPSEQDVFSFETRIASANGKALSLSTKGRIERDARGRSVGVVGASVDVTRERLLEEQLLQAQKMEAIGRLAGGIAHDFNNILTVILTQASMLVDEEGLEPSAQEAVRTMAGAADRAASLTAQLLAFGRQQVMQVSSLDLSETVAHDVKMIERMIGERIECLYVPALEPLGVRGDASMLTQVLLNLAVNARDAMPRGGRFTIRTSNATLNGEQAAQIVDAKPGPYACIEVSDTGVGIAEGVLPHVFEPFYTTKGVGEGTGLGLATSYGIVRQHGGFITVTSEVGKGTTFRVCLPLEVPPAVAAVRRRSDSAPGRGSETILLVEDEDAVRKILSKMLGHQGYRVLTAATGNEALAHWRAHREDIDLVLSDVVLPGGVSGTELVERLRRDRPGLRAILSSGYSADAAGQDFELQEGIRFLQKPYHAPKLLRELRAALEEEGPE